MKKYFCWYRKKQKNKCNKQYYESGANYVLHRLQQERLL